MPKLHFQQPLLQSSVSHDASEIMLYVDLLFLIIISVKAVVLINISVKIVIHFSANFHFWVNYLFNLLDFLLWDGNRLL